MRSYALAVLAVTTGIATTLFACTTNDETVPPADAGTDAGVVDSAATDGGPADAPSDADAQDDDDFVVPDAAVACETSPCVKSITGYSDGFCALLDDGRASCWGANDNGRLGQDPETSVITTPSLVDGIEDITHLEVANENTCARTANGSIYCWGSLDLVHAGIVPPDGGELPFGSTPRPTRQDAVPPAQSIAVGAVFACVTMSDGSLTCWGTNERRELGRGPTDSTESPALPGPARASLLTETASAVIAGLGRTFVIAPDGNVLSWGANTAFGAENFLIGRDTSEDPNERPTRVPLLSRVRGISTSFWHSCAVAGRFVECWGSNSNGQLGRGGFGNLPYLPARTILADVTDADDTDASAPTEHDVPVQVVTSRLHSCAVLGSGRVYCWGNAGPGRVLGAQVKTDVIRGRPTRIDGLSGPAVALAAGYDAMCALLRSGTVECWGGNNRGQLGTGTTDSAPHPTPVRLHFSR